MKELISYHMKPFFLSIADGTAQTDIFLIPFLYAKLFPLYFHYAFHIHYLDVTQ